MSIRAVIDTSSLVPARLRRDLQQATQLGAFTAIWSPWIIAELNRVLVWRWIKDERPNRTVNDLSDANERRCGESAKRMREILLPSFEVVTPLPPYPPVWEALHATRCWIARKSRCLPPYPPVWEALHDQWDHPIWAAAKLGNATYVVSENTHDYPPLQDGRHVYEGIEYLSGAAFLALLTEGAE